MAADDLGAMWSAQADKRRWSAERENATARLELAQINEACAFLVSQHEPLASLGLDRNVLRVLLSFIRHGDKHRLTRELESLKKDST